MIPQNEMCAVCDYGSAAAYRALPSEEQIRTGVVPLDSLPAAWWNCMWFDTNRAVNQARCELGILIEELNTVLCQAGVCACGTCIDQLYQSIDKIRQTLGTPTVAGAVKSSSDPSAVAINAQGFMSVNCLGNASALTTVASTVVGAINELKSTYDCCFADTTTALGNKAPTSHASSATTYGVGNATCYGHVMLSDTFTSDLGCAGVAASQTGLACAYCCLYSMIGGVASLGNTAACPLYCTGTIGICNTAARSDHRHPLPACMANCVVGFVEMMCNCNLDPCHFDLYGKPISHLCHCDITTSLFSLGCTCACCVGLIGGSSYDTLNLTVNITDTALQCTWACCNLPAYWWATSQQSGALLIPFCNILVHIWKQSGVFNCVYANVYVCNCTGIPFMLSSAGDSWVCGGCWIPAGCCIKICSWYETNPSTSPRCWKVNWISADSWKYRNCSRGFLPPMVKRILRG